MVCIVSVLGAPSTVLVIIEVCNYLGTLGWLPLEAISSILQTFRLHSCYLKQYPRNIFTSPGLFNIRILYIYFRPKF